MANAKACREKARTAKSRGLAAAREGDDAFMFDEQDLQVEGAVHIIQGKAMKVMFKTCGIAKENYHFHSTDSDRCCRQCATTWSPKDIKYEGVRLKTIPGRREKKQKTSWFPPNMWFDSSAQRRKCIDVAIEVASYLRKNETLRIDQALKIVSMCLPSLFSFSAPLIRWPEVDFKNLTAIRLRAYKNALNIGCSTAACLLTFPRENGGLQVKLPLVTLFDSMWPNLERCYQFDDGTRQMMKLAYQEALTDNARSNLLELQKEAGSISWNKVGENEFTFACHLANKLEIEVLWDTFNEYTISAAPNIALATLCIKAGLQLKIQILGVQVLVKCLSIDVAGFITTTTDHSRLYSFQINRQGRSPGLPSFRKAITTTYRKEVWLSQLPGFPSARPAEDVADDRSAQGASSGEDSDEVTDLTLPDDQDGDEMMSNEELGSPDMPTKGWI